jgi:arginase
MSQRAKEAVGIIGAPMDLGSTRRGVDMGPSALRFGNLRERLETLGHTVEDLGDVPVAQRQSLAPGPEALLSAVIESCRFLANLTQLAVERGLVPLTIGGDHSIAAGSIAGVADAYARRGERIGLIWLDAHGDLHTPSSSVSGNIHGMPLAHLLGHGDARLARIAQHHPAVSVENLAIVGVRDLDLAEKEFIDRHGITVYTMRDVDERGLRSVMNETIARVCENTAGFHLSVDADWVDPSEAPGVGTPVRGGATFREAHLAMELAHDSGRLLGMDFVEVNPIIDTMNRTGELGADLIASAFGLRVLARGASLTQEFIDRQSEMGANV